LNVPLEVLFDAKATPTDMSNVKENAA
jgi:hypothetical protein